ncbi:MAG: ATP-dependent helicase [Candidatus Kapaibacteriales bacterium]
MNKNNFILENLNTQQRKAVEEIEGPILVVAGAGSGKTRVLTHKIAYLIDLGVPPQNILALTFTNKAAQVMRDRIGKLINPEAARKVWAGTFHSLFARILRVEANNIGYTSSFSIYDADDSAQIIKRIIASSSFSRNRITYDGVQSTISLAKNQIISAEDFARNASTPIEREIAAIYKEYQDTLRRNNAMDFDDLLVNTYELFNTYPEILEKYQERFTFILVDEYQDTNHAQYLVLILLSKKYKNITVVGDDAQSIYRWRGADIRNILAFQKDFPGAKIIRLEQNYRSTKIILGAAGSLIRFNKQQIEKNLWTENNEGQPIEVIICENEKDEARTIVSKIKTIISTGEYTYNDIAILYRINAQSLEFENALRSENIHYLVIGGMSFYRRKEVKDVISYLRLLVNPNDDEALLRIINEPPRGIGKISLNHLHNYAKNKNISLFQTLKEIDSITLIQKRVKIIVNEFINWLESKIEKISLKVGVHDEIVKYIEESGILEMYEQIGTDEAFDRIENIQTLISDLYDFLKNNPNSSIEDYIQQISLISDIDEKDLSNNQVKLMTLHSAKGLEFPVVFIVGLEQGIFPLVRYGSNRDDEEEERRLFYVGLTRAMDRVYLSYAKNRQRFGMDTYQLPSKFLSEIDKKYLIFNPNTEKPGKEYSYSSYDESNNLNFYNEYNQTHDNVLMVGNRVLHPFFGIGRIEKLEGFGSNLQALVLFETVGRKRLMVQFAKLKKLED